MHKATLTLVSPFTGEYTRIIEADDVAMFYARIVGTVEGAIAAGSVVSGLSYDEVPA